MSGEAPQTPPSDQKPNPVDPKIQQMIQEGDGRADESTGQLRGMKLALFAAAAMGVGGYIYLEQQDKAKGAVARVTTYETASEIRIGGPWSGLVDMNGVPASSEDYKDKYLLLYFGFTHCPDICPTEIKKMMAALDKIEKKHPDVYSHIRSAFITVDPARDTPERLKEYASEHHPRLRWITGPMENIRATAKKFRVYFSIPDDIQPGENYLVDHSIYFFMMGRKGQFMEFYGKNLTADEVAIKMTRAIKEDLAKSNKENSNK